MSRFPDQWPPGDDAPFWLAIGEDAAEALRAHGAAFFQDDAPAIEVVHSVIDALMLLPDRPTLGCVVSGEVLDARPHAALESLKRQVAPGPMLVHATGQEAPGVREAAERLGIPVWQAKPSDEGPTTATATAPRPRTEAPKPAEAPAAPPPLRSPEPEADAAPQEVAPPEVLPRADDDRPAPGLADVGRFAEGCLQRIGRLRSLVRYTVRTMSEVSNATRVSLLLREADRGTLRLREGRGVRENLVGTVRCRIGTGIAGRVAALGRPVTGRGAPGGERRYTGRAYVVLPMGTGRRCEGVLCLTGLPDDALPDAATVRSWTKLARRAGVALRGARTLQRARSLAVHDELTSLPNRRAFERALKRELERARRAGTRLVVGLFDVDHFKSVNDHYGHSVGDVVLQEVARRLQHAFRETDLVTRWGGEEFAVLLPGLESAPDARPQDLMERGWGAVRARPFQLGESLAPGRVTVSGGFAVFPRDGVAGAALIDKADQALYRAKEKGRDRIEGAEGG